MGDDKKRNWILESVGEAISRAGELGIKAGDAIKDFAESDATEKMIDNVKNGVQTTVDGVVKGTQFAVDEISSSAKKVVDNIKENVEENEKMKAEKKALRDEIRAELAAEEARTRKIWFSVGYISDSPGVLTENSNLIFDKAEELGIECGYVQAQGMRFLYSHCSKEKMEKLAESLGEGYGYSEVKDGDKNIKPHFQKLRKK